MTDLADVRVRARVALANAARRTEDLFASIADGSRPVQRSQWTVAEVGAHLLVGLRAYTDSAQGTVNALSPYLPATENYRERMHAVTGTSLDLFPERSPATLARMVPAAVDEFLLATAALAPDAQLPTPWYAPSGALTVTAATCLLLGEQLMHGYDVARTVRRPWPLRRDDALLLVEVFKNMLPFVVDPAAAAGADANVLVHMRGGSRFAVHVRGGAVEVSENGTSRSEKFDCHLSADPVAFTLVGYGRINQYRAIATGGLLAWGRRPWTALRFRGLFYNP